MQGFFRTGDVACWSAENECYKILGRASADIIKSAGHKVCSAVLLGLVLPLAPL